MANYLVLTSLKDHLAERTKKGADMAIPPNGVLWTVLPPLPSVDEALQRALKGDKRHIGVLMPQQDVLVKTTRGPVADNQPPAGAIRELHLTATVFVRSMRLDVTSGSFLIFTDWLDELVRTFVYQGTYGGTLKDVQYMGLPPDYLIVEGHVAVRYSTEVSTYDWPKLLQTDIQFVSP